MYSTKRSTKCLQYSPPKHSPPPAPPWPPNSAPGNVTIVVIFMFSLNHNDFSMSLVNEFISANLRVSKRRPLGFICQKDKESVAFNVIDGINLNIVHTNFMYSI